MEYPDAEVDQHRILLEHFAAGSDLAVKQNHDAERLWWLRLRCFPIGDMVVGANLGRIVALQVGC